MWPDDLTPDEIHDIVSGLKIRRQLVRKHYNRNVEGLARWTDERETQNPGYRAFLEASNVRQLEHIARIDTLMRKIEIDGNVHRDHY